ncbi:hypothetical protein N7481_009261 [Penicillium waksmanii]|uniref:uncharacterized protein n=1 Tax=Penicillium waksmanii TaxID=69791 RepID=UPI0025497EFF|nr:uncharacterized protein N7481_009261 [Penicillium waksmanii]KAJ5975554.1 hypothetical protein N7481_009261 [Penicillium waksmanii]
MVASVHDNVSIVPPKPSFDINTYSPFPQPVIQLWEKIISEERSMEEFREKDWPVYTGSESHDLSPIILSSRSTSLAQPSPSRTRPRPVNQQKTRSRKRVAANRDITRIYMSDESDHEDHVSPAAAAVAGSPRNESSDGQENRHRVSHLKLPKTKKKRRPLDDNVQPKVQQDSDLEEEDTIFSPLESSKRDDLIRYIGLHPLLTSAQPMKQSAWRRYLDDVRTKAASVGLSKLLTNRLVRYVQRNYLETPDGYDAAPSEPDSTVCDEQIASSVSKAKIETHPRKRSRQSSEHPRAKKAKTQIASPATRATPDSAIESVPLPMMLRPLEFLLSTILLLLFDDTPTFVDLTPVNDTPTATDSPTFEDAPTTVHVPSADDAPTLVDLTPVADASTVEDMPFVDEASTLDDALTVDDRPSVADALTVDEMASVADASIVDDSPIDDTPAVDDSAAVGNTRIVENASGSRKNKSRKNRHAEQSPLAAQIRGCTLSTDAEITREMSPPQLKSQITNDQPVAMSKKQKKKQKKRESQIQQAIDVPRTTHSMLTDPSSKKVIRRRSLVSSAPSADSKRKKGKKQREKDRKRRKFEQEQANASVDTHKEKDKHQPMDVAKPSEMSPSLPHTPKRQHKHHNTNVVKPVEMSPPRPHTPPATDSPSSRSIANVTPEQCSQVPVCSPIARSRKMGHGFLISNDSPSMTPSDEVKSKYFQPKAERHPQQATISEMHEQTIPEATRKILAELNLPLAFLSSDSSLSDLESDDESDGFGLQPLADVGTCENMNFSPPSPHVKPHDSDETQLPTATTRNQFSTTSA